MSDAAEFFEELRREYLSEASARLGELRKDVAALRAGEADAAGSLKVRLHRLAGSGGSYGFPDISSASRATEQWIIANPSPDAEGFAHLDRSIAAIAGAFDAAARQLGLPAAPARPAAFSWRALVIANPGSAADRAAAALVEAQYAVSHRPITADPTAVPVSERPDVVTIIASRPEELRAAVERWTKPGPERPGAVFVVAPAGGGGVDPLVEPFASADGVIPSERLDAELLAAARGTGRVATAPRSVLIAATEGQSAVGALVSALEGAAVRVTLTPGGFAARDHLGREPVDLIVIDWRLADASAAALIRWARRQPSQRFTPIVVTAATVDESLRLSALRAGADEVVSQETPAGPLAQSILARIDRSRVLRASAHRDDLTGLLTQDAMTEELDRAIGYARRVGETTALLMIDIDHFRRINERHGPPGGDLTLIHVGKLVAGSVRATDPVGRMGGEEFAVLVRRCRPADAARVAEKIHDAIGSAPLTLGEETLAVRASIGIGCFPDHGATGHEVLRAAEQALGRAKQSGRDRVVIGTGL
jgi:diguanylate cyclase (GGDEF)-like protein